MYQSLTTPKVNHDFANALTEIIFLNKNLLCGEYPWKKDPRFWGKTVSVIKKMMNPPFSLEKDQLSYYVYRCKPTEINSAEFAKMAVVAKKLLFGLTFDELRIVYQKRINDLKDPLGTIDIESKKQNPMSLLDLIKELENGKR